MISLFKDEEETSEGCCIEDRCGMGAGVRCESFLFARHFKEEKSVLKLVLCEHLSDTLWAGVQNKEWASFHPKTLSLRL